MVRNITIREDDTEPLDIVVSATGLSNLDELSSALLYLRKRGSSSNHVNGVALTVADSEGLRLRFDPVGAKNGGGNAFDTVGRYEGYVKLTWSDGDITRHPGFPQMLGITVLRHFE